MEQLLGITFKFCGSMMLDNISFLEINEETIAGQLCLYEFFLFQSINVFF